MTKALKSYREFVNALNQSRSALIANDLQKITFIYGASSYLIEKAAASLIGHWTSKGSTVSQLEAKGLRLEELASCLEQGSIFESECLYVIRRLEKNLEISNKIGQFTDNSSTSNKICFTFYKESIPNNLLKELTRLKAQIIPCWPPAKGEIARFITGLALKKEMQLDAGAVRLITQTQGLDLYKLDNEVNVLSLIFYGANRPLTANCVAPYLGMIREDHIFELDRLLVSGKLAEAQALLFDLSKRGEKALALIGLIASHCRKTIKVKQMHNKGQGEAEIARELHLPTFVVNSYLKHIRNIKMSSYLKLLRNCQESDYLLKTSSMSDLQVISGIISSL